MGMMLGGGRGARGRRTMNAEINVAPLVDVMLVLLIIFIISAPLLVRGEEVSLPRTDSAAIPGSQSQPLAITINAEGTIFIQNTEIAPADLVSKLNAITDTGYEELIYIRADEATAHGAVMDVTARVRQAGYSRIAFVTDPNGRGEQ
ncbi:MAG: biopolymer transporter ExbD [Pseudomonadota bacterium]